MGVLFEWDEWKNRANQDKHGVSFEEAAGIWDDEDMLVVPARRRGEKRLLAIGRIHVAVYAVIHTERGVAVRIISARLATEKERQAYERNAR